MCVWENSGEEGVERTGDGGDGNELPKREGERVGEVDSEAECLIGQSGFL